MKPRALLFWPHLATGSVAGLVILTMSVTGIALAYRGEVTAWAEREYRVSPAGLPRLSVESLLRAVRALADSAPLSSVVESADPEAPVVLGFGRERVVLVDPYTGGDLGPGPRKLVPSSASSKESTGGWASPVRSGLSERPWRAPALWPSWGREGRPDRASRPSSR